MPKIRTWKKYFLVILDDEQKRREIIEDIRKLEETYRKIKYEDKYEDGIQCRECGQRVTSDTFYEFRGVSRAICRRCRPGLMSILD